MKKSNLIKIFLVVLLSVALLLGMLSTFAYAADDDGFGDLTSTLDNPSDTNNTNNNTNANTNINNTNVNNTNTNSNSTSIYNNTNTNLPNTGVSDSIPVAMLVVIFGISAIYAYKKIKEYRNI